MAEEPHVRHIYFLEHREAWFVFLEDTENPNVESLRKRGFIWADSLGDSYMELPVYGVYVLEKGMRFRTLFFSSLVYLGGIKEFCYIEELVKKDIRLAMLDPDTLVTEIWSYPGLERQELRVYVKGSFYDSNAPGHGAGWYVSREERLKRFQESDRVRQQYKKS